MNPKNTLRLLWQYAKLLVNNLYDVNRFFAGAASTARPMTDEQLKARLLQRAHSIEKGLSLPHVRPGFGLAPLKELRGLMDAYEKRHLPASNIAYVSARHTMSAYLDFHVKHGFSIPDEVAFVKEKAVASHDCTLGGVISMDAESVTAQAMGDFQALVNARHSTRTFAPGIPDTNKIEDAIRLAAQSPSVCNRQGGRARIITNKDLLKDALTIQGGNRGFTDEIPAIIVVTCYLGLFRGARERNQCWIDGGLFAMSLLYGLTYKGLGACPLNWSADFKQDKKIRRLLDLPADEVVIMLVAVGNLKPEYQVAASPRWGQDTTLQKIYS